MSAVVAKLYDQRTATRHAVSLEGTLRDEAWRPHEIVVENLSATGFRIPADTEIPLWSRIGIGLAGLGARSAQVVRCDEQGWYGCEFDVALTPIELNTLVTGQPKSTVIAMPWTPDPVLDAPVLREGGLSSLSRLCIMFGVSVALWAGLGIGAWVLL